jgi:site-specific recombinase XerD
VIIADHRDILAEDDAPATVKRYLAALSHTFTVAVCEWQWMNENPCQRVSKPTEPRGRIRFLSDDERQQLLEACKTSRCPYLYIVVLIALPRCPFHKFIISQAAKRLYGLGG